MIPLTVGGYFSKTKALEARTALLNSGYFYSVEPSATKYEDGVYLTYNVVENMYVDKIEIEGNTLFNDEELKGLIKSKDKSVFKLVNAFPTVTGNVAKSLSISVLTFNKALETLEAVSSPFSAIFLSSPCATPNPLAK